MPAKVFWKNVLVAIMKVFFWPLESSYTPSIQFEPSDLPIMLGVDIPIIEKICGPGTLFIFPSVVSASTISFILFGSWISEIADWIEDKILSLFNLLS